MPASLPVALALLAETAVYGPSAPPPAKPAPKAVAQDGCANEQPNRSNREIVICAERPNGYRLDPDLIEARREKREIAAVRRKTPAEKAQIDSCAIGPNSCVPTGPDLLGVAIGVVTMAARLAQGKEVGSMFETEPQPDEYHLYLAAKHRREARQAAATAAAIVAKAKAEQATSNSSSSAIAKAVGVTAGDGCAAAEVR